MGMDNIENERKNNTNRRDQKARMRGSPLGSLLTVTTAQENKSNRN